MKNNFAVFILTHKRPNKQITLNMLREQGYTGKIYLIVDDLDETVDELKENHSSEAEIVIFNKEEMYNKIDTVDNFHNLKSVVYARNFAHEFAKKQKIDYFLTLDDDIKALRYRYVENNVLKGKLAYNLDDVFNKIIKMLDLHNIYSVSFGGPVNYIGGVNGMYKERITFNCNQSFFQKKEKKIDFNGTINEDNNACLLNNKVGKFMINILDIQQESPERGTNEGGLQNLYNENNEYIRAFYSMICSPDNLKIKYNGKIILQRRGKDYMHPQILNEVYKK